MLSILSTTRSSLYGLPAEPSQSPMSSKNPNAQSMLSSVLSVGKSSVRKVGLAEIEQLIRSQPEVTGRVSVNDLGHDAEVGASSGIVRFAATYDAGNGVVTRDLVLRHAPGSAKQLFHEY